MLLAAACFWTLDLGVLRAGTPDPLDDTWEYGVAARHLLAGEGFRTSVIHPPLWTLRDAHLTVPVLVHGPLLPLLLAPLLGAFGPGLLDRIAVLAALLATLAALLTFRLGRRHFGEPVGIAAALLFTLAPLTLRAVHHDVSLALGAALFMLALDLLARERPRALAAGLVLGAACLTRPEMLVAAPVLAVLAGRRGLRALLPGMVVVVAPWWWHAFRATGSPLFNLSGYLAAGYSVRWPGLTILRDFDLAPDRWPQTLAAALPSLPAKWLENLPHVLKRALLVPTGATGWLAAGGAIAGLASTTGRRVTAVALACTAIPLAVMTATLYDSRYLTPFLPLWALAAATGMSAIAARAPRWARRPRAWIGLLLLLAPLLGAFGPGLLDRIAVLAALLA
ncbi:MAG: glycosyltransferase family 39 protein, partial [Candidatus Eisenbacteria bacterium]|nr:glycosyltransferase family 39 protein [Candidatus Eisenbacteria bacterium]